MNHNLDTTVVRLVGTMPDALTINESAETTGWSPRMLRYIEKMGLIEPQRSDGGYRLYGAGELQRLRTLRELLSEQDLTLGDVGIAQRLRNDPSLRAAVEGWLDAKPQRPAHVGAGDWLTFEQDKHSALLEAVRARTPQATETTAA